MSSTEKIETIIYITGRVQGVDFRPYIYREAVKNHLSGYVTNLGDAGVEIVVEGNKKDIESLLDELKEKAPNISEIENISNEFRPYRNRFTEFVIDKSQNRGKVASGIFPPDIGICDQCLKDMENYNGRWYIYPFTACAWCGPRFTGIRALPYDRERTHIHKFPRCKFCKEDYMIL